MIDTTTSSSSKVNAERFSAYERRDSSEITADMVAPSSTKRR
jgi:hypothetical protein